jgi:hypothetical protein
MQREEDRPRERPADHRRRTRRAERHATSHAIHSFEGEDIDAAAPVRSVHDIGHKTSKAPRSAKPGRREGFKVWKTPFWKRRKQLRAERARAERAVADQPGPSL